MSRGQLVEDIEDAICEVITKHGECPIDLKEENVTCVGCIISNLKIVKSKLILFGVQNKDNDY